MFDLLSRLKDPAIFQGNLGKRNYFEGWYFKHVGSEGAKFAVIPGISLAKKDSHSFIQVFNGVSGESKYVTFTIDDFQPEKESFGVVIGENHFSYNGLELNMEGVASGYLHYSDRTPYHYSWRERGVMGWYGYVPFMETYHGLLSLDHRVDGSMDIGGDIQIFQNGDGYIEKDWGTSFPSSWIWMQSNSFEEKGDSFMLSTAVIPWLGSSFIGHLAIIRIGGKTINLSTYKGGKIVEFNKIGKRVIMTLQSRSHTLKVDAVQGDSVHLKSPQSGLMTGRTIESLSSTLKVTLTDNRKSTVVFKGTGLHAGLEIMDDKNELIQGLNLL